MSLEEQHKAFFEISRARNINPEVFFRQDVLNDGIGLAKHVKWAYANIYSVPYPNSKLPRAHHGITHVTRAALYVPVLVNFWRKHELPNASQVTGTDIELMQIALLFHDSARLDEGEDLWDAESAILLYYYLTQVMGVDQEKASKLAEATANKDPLEKGYFYIRTNDENKVDWGYRQEQTDEISIYQKIIHDADSLDIIRARSHFDSSYTCFVEEINRLDPKAQQVAKDDFAMLINEARSLIHKHGEDYLLYQRLVNIATRQKYHCAEALDLIQADIDPDNYPVLHALSTPCLSKDDIDQMPFWQIPPFNPREGFDPTNLKAALWQGKLWLRGVKDPSMADGERAETNAELEIRKTLRTTGIATNTKKENRLEKRGNPLRSVSMAGFGAAPFTPSGFVVLGSDPDAVSLVASQDAHSGMGKKKDNSPTNGFHKGMITGDTNSSSLETQLNSLLDKLKAGGDTTPVREGLRVRNDLILGTHNEILCDMTKYDAIFFTDGFTSQKREATYESALLEAIYLRYLWSSAYKEMLKKYTDKWGGENGSAAFKARFGSQDMLPIIYYSASKSQVNCLTEDELSDDKIIELCKLYIIPLLLEDIETPRNHCYLSDSMFIDTFCLSYPDSLKERVELMISEQKAELTKSNENKILEKVHDNPILIRDPAMMVQILFSERLQEELKESVESELLVMLENPQNLTRQISLDSLVRPLTDITSYSPKLCLMYELCGRLQLNDVRAQIQELARVEALLFFQAPKESIILKQNIVNLYSFFDLKQELEPLRLIQLKKTIINQMIDYENLAGWGNIIQSFDCDHELIGLIRDSFNSFIHNLDRRNIHRVLPGTLHKFSIHLGLDPLVALKKFFSTDMASQAYSLEVHLMNYINQLSGISIDIELFNLVVAKINQISFPPDVWLSYIEKLESVLDNKQFSAQQYHLIEQSVVSKVGYMTALIKLKPIEITPSSTSSDELVKLKTVNVGNIATAPIIDVSTLSDTKKVSNSEEPPPGISHYGEQEELKPPQKGILPTSPGVDNRLLEAMNNAMTEAISDMESRYAGSCEQDSTKLITLKLQVSDCKTQKELLALAIEFVRTASANRTNAINFFPASYGDKKSAKAFYHSLTSAGYASLTAEIQVASRTALNQDNIKDNPKPGF